MPVELGHSGSSSPASNYPWLVTERRSSQSTARPSASESSATAAAILLHTHLASTRERQCPPQSQDVCIEPLAASKLHDLHFQIYESRCSPQAVSSPHLPRDS